MLIDINDRHDQPHVDRHDQPQCNAYICLSLRIKYFFFLNRVSISLIKCMIYQSSPSFTNGPCFTNAVLVLLIECSRAGKGWMRARLELPWMGMGMYTSRQV